jgi:hypothetical protein
MKALILVLTGMLVVASAAGRAQNPPPASDTHTKMAGQQQMMASMQAADKKLDDLVAQLNAARGDDRLDKVIAVVKELVAERKTMRDMMAGRGGMMMNKESAAPTTGGDHSTHHPEPGK